MSSIRPAAVAGRFYPGDAAELTTLVNALLAARRSDLPPPKAAIAPHAGYLYSGPIAASAYARIANGRKVIRRVVLLGPSHRVALRGMAVSDAAAFATPLGTVPVDAKAMVALRQLPQVMVSEEAHRLEHSLEVHLPFLQRCLTDFTLVPLVVGEAEAEEVEDVLERLWGGPETLIVVSSDLSHYHDYETARRLDRATSDAIVALEPSAIHYEQACGRNPILGLLRAARRRGMDVEVADLRNSGDTAGPRERVVGYGAYMFQ
jgi:AmmeMemoRadiSam system protein B